MAGEIQEVNDQTLETARQVVEQEMDARWQRELQTYPNLKREEEFFATLDPNEPRDPDIIEARRASLENMKVGLYLNNFLFHLPPAAAGERGKSQIGYTRIRMPEINPEWLSEKPADYNFQSKLKAGQTNQQFYETVDRAFGEEYIDMNELAEMGRKAEMQWADSRDQLRFNQTLLRVFIRLRAMGYNRGDLAA